MKKLLIKTFNITNDSMILAIPLVIFIVILNAYIDYTQIAAKTLPGLLLAFLTVFFMVGAFLSGWFYMVKKTIKFAQKEFVMDSDRTKELMNLFRKIPTGIGKYFLSFISFAFLVLVLAVVVTNILGIIGIIFIGIPDIDPALIKSFGTTVAEHRAFLNSLSYTQLTSLFRWEILIYAGYVITLFFTFLWVPEIIYSTKNSFFALFLSMKKICKKFLKTMGVFVIFVFLHTFVSLIMEFINVTPIIYILGFILKFYLVVFSTILVFTYYENEFVKAE